MIILDRNLADEEIRDAMRGLSPRVEIFDQKHMGVSDRLSDEQIVTELREFKDCIFVTHNEADFFGVFDADPLYCIVTTDTKGAAELASRLKRFIRSGEFNTAEKRNGRVYQLRAEYVRFYRRVGDGRWFRHVYATGLTAPEG